MDEIKGGPGSGYHGHAGRPGLIGGSAPSGESTGSEQTGESAQSYLDKLVSDAIEKNKVTEANVTARVKEVAEENGGEMAGLEHRIKSPESLRRKIVAMVRDGEAEDYEEAAEKIKDGVRYTAVLNEDGFAEKVKAVQDSMRDAGYERYDHSWRNYFLSDGPYRGYNTAWWNPKTGEKFELQFHTGASLRIKELAHEIYEKARATNDVREAMRYRQEMIALWRAENGYAQPEGAENLEGVVL